MSGLLELADRCERAAGPDRELDQDIHETVVMRCAKSERAYPHCAKVTASIDAALTLVPEGCGVEIRLTASNLKLLGIPQMGLARVFYVPKIDCVTAGATPALALVAAALRARASLTQSKGDRDDQQ